MDVVRLHFGPQFCIFAYFWSISPFQALPLKLIKTIALLTLWTHCQAACVQPAFFRFQNLSLFCFKSHKWKLVGEKEYSLSQAFLILCASYSWGMLIRALTEMKSWVVVVGCLFAPRQLDCCAPSCYITSNCLEKEVGIKHMVRMMIITA